MEQAALLTKLKQQDPQAFGFLVQKYHQSMLSIVRPIAGDTWVEEVVQEAWISIYKALPDFEGRSSLKTWIFTIVRNEAYSRYKKEARLVSLEASVKTAKEDMKLDEWLNSSFNEDGHWSTSFQWDLGSPEAILQEEQLLQCIEHALELMQADQKAIFVLRDQEQLEMEEVCNILGISYSNARVLLHRARMKLFKVINYYQETGEC
jgi:RNA polymerase sigma-70 factor (ECF subfamily)